MLMTTSLRPDHPGPQMRFNTVSHGGYDLATDVPPGGTFLVFHRGGHCKWTRLMLKELDDRIGDFALRGIRVVAVSGETLEASTALNDRMQLIRLPLGYGLDVTATALDWGLHLTNASSEDNAPALHWEPAQFWLRSNGFVGAAAVQTGPCLWPDVTNSIRAIENTMNKFPERGAGVSNVA